MLGIYGEFAFVYVPLFSFVGTYREFAFGDVPHYPYAGTYKKLYTNMSCFEISKGHFYEASTIMPEASLFWIFSVFVLLFALVSFTTNGGILSGLLFLITAILINPLVQDLVRKKLFTFAMVFSITRRCVNFIMASYCPI